MFRPASRFSRILLAAASSSSPPNPYEVLGLNADTADEKEIKKAHRTLAMKFHPDNNTTGDADKFREVQTAFDNLKASGWKYYKPPDGSQDASSSGGGFGGDPNNASRAGTHWNPPGSTSENYVQNNGKLQAGVRLVVMWCMLFAIARYILSSAFPDLKGRKAAQDLMMKQLEEHENKRREKLGGSGGNNSNVTKKEGDDGDISEKAIIQFVDYLHENDGANRKKPKQVVNNDDGQDNSNEFSSWGDLNNKNKNDTSNSNNSGQHWPKADHDPLSSRKW